MLGSNMGIPFDIIIRVFDILIMNQMDYLVFHAFVLTILKRVENSFLDTHQPNFEELMTKISTSLQITFDENSFFEDLFDFLKKLHDNEEKAEADYLDK